MKNVIHEWLDRAQAEFATPDEMRAAAEKCTDKNTKKLLIQRAATWGAILIAERTQHWSKSVHSPNVPEIYRPTSIEKPNPKISPKRKPNPRIRA